jgi:hypothetical protein
MVESLLTRWQCIPPFSQDLTNSPVVGLGMTLVHKSAVSFAEDHEGVHWPTNVRVFSLQIEHNPVKMISSMLQIQGRRPNWRAARQQC